MTQLALSTDSTESPFDAIRHLDADGTEHWLGRELMSLMDYSRWERFATVINKAKGSLALVQGEQAAEHHFPIWGSDGGRWGGKVEDFRLTRFGAYLTAMAGDDTKPAVAQARIYFAVKTRQAEIAEQNANRPAIPQTFADALQLAADQARAIERQQTHIAELEPKAAQADHHRAADGLQSVGDFANELKAWAQRECGVRVKHEDVWAFLADINLLIRGNTVRHNQPTAFATERDFIRKKTSEFETNTRGLQASTSPRLTPAGAGWAWDRAVKRIRDHGALAASTDISIKGA